MGLPLTAVALAASWWYLTRRGAVGAGGSGDTDGLDVDEESPAQPGHVRVDGHGDPPG